MSGRLPIERAPCSACGAPVAFTSFVRMDIALSEYCNLRCQMCRRPSETRFLDAQLCKNVMSEAVDLGVECLSFSGGEPFVHPEFVDILAHALSLGVRVQLVSNGTLIRERHLDLLERLDCLTISVDGTEAAHDRIRRRDGAWRRTMDTLRMLSTDSSVNWGTNTVMQRDNHDCLWDCFRTVQDIGGLRYRYCGFAHVEVVPETADLQMTSGQEAIAYEQILRIDDARHVTFTWLNERDALLAHFSTYARKDKRYRPIDGCKIPQKFIGFSDNGFHLCWHQGRSVQAPTLTAALDHPTARDVVLEALEKRCVACNCFNYSWDEEWSRGIEASALAGDSVELGIVPLRVTRPARLVAGGAPGNTIEVPDV
jgi:hypothetical protein